MVAHLSTHQTDMDPELVAHINAVSLSEPALSSLMVVSPEAQAEGVNPQMLRKFSNYDDVFKFYLQLFENAFDDSFQDRAFENMNNRDIFERDLNRPLRNLFEEFMDFSHRISGGSVGFLEHRRDPELDTYLKYIRRKYFSNN